MSVLVNGSPTTDFEAEKGLKQGDPLSHFLFTIFPEGIARILAKSKVDGSFKGFRVSNSLSFELLQFFVDDTVIVDEGCWSNLWCIKAILTGFGLVSGLQVNLSKSSLMGVHVAESFMQTASDFLCCKVGKIPFPFLGIQLGCNQRQRSTWAGVVNKMRRRLSSWKCRCLSIGGRITLINFVLNAIPGYYLSFYKIPKVVLAEMVKLQREFLWCGGGGSEMHILA
ncbi:uncharacterized protein LOC131650124 [Vicia villosa]|uniref:uncharacterized protein LOC131650124 n=1 Tax=Vicia villosa TaxID=3911 RepID=UPI00273C6204|nr:uncharacterized protein LOC131650124 [Vicia villosa]